MRPRFLLSLLLLLVFPGAASAQWPQWGGPDGDFSVKVDKPLAPWPEDGPRRIWSRPLGDGNSAVSVDDGVLFTMYRSGDEEVVIALDPSDGRTVWEYRYGAPFWPDFYAKHSPGPHAAPSIVADRVFTCGIRGTLNCLDRSSGRKLWAYELWQGPAGQPLDCGYAASPLPYKDLIIAPSGGKGRGVVALNQADGDVAWTAGDFQAAYASPRLITVDGQDQLVVFVRDWVAGMHPATGAVLWQHPHKTEHHVNASMPLWIAKDNLLFVSSAYSTGSRALRLTREGDETSVEQAWAAPKLHIHHGNAVAMRGRIFGSSGDFGPALLFQADARTGKTISRQRGFAKANLLRIGRQLLALDEDGKLALLRPTKTDLEVLAEAEIVHGRAWTVPTLVGTTLYVRDRQEIAALDLSA